MRFFAFQPGQVLLEFSRQRQSEMVYIFENADDFICVIEQDRDGRKLLPAIQNPCVNDIAERYKAYDQHFCCDTFRADFAGDFLLAYCQTDTGNVVNYDQDKQSVDSVRQCTDCTENRNADFGCHFFAFQLFVFSVAF